MNSFFIRNVDKRYLICYVLPLALIFYGTLSTLYGQSNIIFELLLKTRAASIIAFSMIGWWITKKYRSGSLSTVALIFSVYCYIITIFIAPPADIVTVSATIFFWPITLLIAERSRFSQDTFIASSYIIAVICNLMSFATISGRSNIELLLSMDLAQAVGAANSIYLVLSTLPFVFLVPSKKIRILLLILPMMAFLVASKTTCLLAAVFSLVYFFAIELKHSRNKLKIALSVFLIIYAFLYFGKSFVDFNIVLDDIGGDVDSGGNGRLDIIENVLTLFGNKNILYQILGSGYFAVARDTKLSAHNDFLEIIYDYGFIGISLFLLFWWYLFKKRAYFPKGSNLYVVYTISLIIYLSCCLGSNFIVQQINMLFFALFWGTIDKYPIIYNNK